MHREHHFQIANNSDPHFRAILHCMDEHDQCINIIHQSHVKIKELCRNRSLVFQQYKDDHGTIQDFINQTLL